MYNYVKCAVLQVLQVGDQYRIENIIKYKILIKTLL